MKLIEQPWTFSSNQIRFMTAGELTYTCADGRLDYVDFEDCYQRWARWELRDLGSDPLPIDGRELYERTRGWKEVGSRDALSQPPYIVFYVEPQIRFIFKTYEEISEFQRRMYDLGGWHTYDLA